MFDFVELENEIRELWERVKPYEKVKEKNKGRKKFAYLDGPPFTTGEIHIGHAWGKALRDSIMRYKRLQGFDVFDRPGFDMHGLPIEVEVEKTLHIKNKKAIVEDVGVKKFIETCKTFAINKMYPMIEQFKFMGIWMDWDDPYQTISSDYIENIWWALKKAFENGLLYKDKTVMTWCPRCETALAKHELEYQTLKDTSIYVKLPVRDKKGEFLVIWTTTPWTLPFNLAVMVNPDFDYVRAKVGEEVWIVAKDLAENVISNIAGKEFEIIETFKGSKLEGVSYFPPFWNDWDKIRERDNGSNFRVILSKEYVDLEGGTGLVHTAPGCGKEDFEASKPYGITPFNLVSENGAFPDDSPFAGLVAKKSDAEFIAGVESRGLLVAKVPIEHEYATCWRCKTPIIFRTTDQWFLKSTSLKEKSLEENEGVKWVPEWGGKNAFHSWLEGMQDWCISRQRFWGTPLPIWVCDEGHMHVIGSKKELESLTGTKLDDLHKSSIDNLTFKCDKCEKEMHRILDVLDVWLDSGSVSWAILDYVNHPERFEKYFPFDFILEGRDQIRGWFNSLMNMSVLTFGRRPYDAVYMHGMINDALGRKMSKSQKNYITPYEVFDKFGVDVFRYYSIGATEAGEDLNYNFKDVETKAKNILVLLNTSRYLKTLYRQLSSESKISLKDNDSWVSDHFKDLKPESRFMISEVNSLLKEQTSYFDNYILNKTPRVVEKLYLDLSREYIQLVRETVSFGEFNEKEEVLRVIAYSLKRIIMMLAPITPFISEKLYQDLKEVLSFEEESVHLDSWIAANVSLIDEKLEQEFYVAFSLIQVIQKIRDNIKRGVRWPIKEVVLSNDIDDKMKQVVMNATNVKSIVFKDIKPSVTKEEDSTFYSKAGYSIEPFMSGYVAVNLEQDESLINEGYARELMRLIQNERRKQRLQKEQKIDLFVSGADFLKDFEEMISKRTGAVNIFWKDNDGKEVKIKDKTFVFSFKVL